MQRHQNTFICLRAVLLSPSHGPSPESGGKDAIKPYQLLIWIQQSVLLTIHVIWRMTWSCIRMHDRRDIRITTDAGVCLMAVRPYTCVSSCDAGRGQPYSYSRHFAGVLLRNAIIEADSSVTSASMHGGV